MVTTASPALDAGMNCPLEDQRGFPRPIDYDGDLIAACDIGAVEMPEPGSTAMAVLSMMALAWLGQRRVHQATAVR